MDTYMTFTAYGMDAEAAVLAAEDKIRELEALWSVTDENSDIYAVNHSAGQTVTIDQKTAELVSFALDMAEKTNGVLEPTIYPVLTAWGFTTGENRIPTEIELAGLLDKVGYEKVKLNENQIRCTLTHADLAARHLKLSELAYGTENAKSLFRDMMQQASFDFGFEADDIPLMIEAIPASADSIVLIITKVEDPEELDTRFSKFSPAAEDGDSFLDNLANELLEGADGIFDLLQGLGSSQSPKPESVENAEQTDPSKSYRIFTFPKLDLISEAAMAAGGQFSGESILYKKPEDGPYFLVLKKPADAADFNRVCNTIAEYGSKIRHDYATESYYAEHYEVLIQDNALQILAGL